MGWMLACIIPLAFAFWMFFVCFSGTRIKAPDTRIKNISILIHGTDLQMLSVQTVYKYGIKSVWSLLDLQLVHDILYRIYDTSNHLN